ncbi:MAG: tyrosine-type recombinase/integrase [Chloroflexi bacterium]|nr:tyrosine-type recombinase/integrase [Chloroflexota bacterium]
MEGKGGAFQLPLLKVKNGTGEYPPSLIASRPLSSASSISAAMQAYHAHLAASSYSRHTVKAFLADVVLLRKFIGPNKKVGGIGTAELESFLAYLRSSRGKPCSPKSLNRRVTALKNFFRWLVESNVIPQDPASRLIYKRATSPLPDVLYDEECERLLGEASKDSRTYLLVLLLLETGVKREELLGIRLKDIDLSNQYRPEVWIRHKGKAFKQRKLRLPPEFPAAFRAYMAEYCPQEYLFECSERNLSYLLRNTAQRAGIVKKVSCQVLRDTFAVRQLKAGERIERVFEKLGLAPGSWNDETREKYSRLARPGL